uniref:SoxL1 n=1 Tax=Leucosolenia complicata TaxID=433461 RepID=I7D1J8_9METZ|nr:SoxL1 [Leucosolenia complicata]
MESRQQLIGQGKKPDGPLSVISDPASNLRSRAPSTSARGKKAARQNQAENGYFIVNREIPVDSDTGIEEAETLAEGTDNTMARTHEDEQAQDNGQEAPDAHKPKRPMNAFLTWARTERRRLHGLLPGRMPNSEISKILGQKWKLMPESLKAPYYEQAAHASDEYHSANPRRRRRRCHKIDGPPPPGPSNSLPADMMARLLEFNETTSAPNTTRTATATSSGLCGEHDQDRSHVTLSTQLSTESQKSQGMMTSSQCLSPTDSRGSSDSILGEFDALLTPELFKESLRLQGNGPSLTPESQPPACPAECQTNREMEAAAAHEQPSPWPMMAATQNSNIIQRLLLEPDQLPLQQSATPSSGQGTAEGAGVEVPTSSAYIPPSPSQAACMPHNGIAFQIPVSGQAVIMLPPSQLNNGSNSANMAFANLYGNSWQPPYSNFPGVNGTANCPLPPFLAGGDVLDEAIEMAETAAGIYFPSPV